MPLNNVGKRQINVEQSRSKQQLNWADLGFQYHKTDWRFRAGHVDGAWSQGELISSEIIPVHEGAPSLHYAQQCFEGLKAQTAPDGRVLACAPNISLPCVR